MESNNSQNESDVCEDDIINDNIHHLPQNSTHRHDFCALLLPSIPWELLTLLCLWWPFNNKVYKKTQIFYPARWRGKKFIDGLNLHIKKKFCTKISLIFVWISPVDEVDISVEPSLDEMQRTAIDLKFSRRGEMFTAKNLADLINKCFSHYQVRNNPYNTLPPRKMNYHSSFPLKGHTTFSRHSTP